MKKQKMKTRLYDSYDVGYNTRTVRLYINGKVFDELDIDMIVADWLIQNDYIEKVN